MVVVYLSFCSALKGNRPMGRIKSSEKPIIKVRGLHKYFGPVHIIKGVDLDVRPSEVVVIMGPSGGGKSTFLRCLNFLEEELGGNYRS
jgi:polar amino acid transport system ATP-binding protein